MRINIHLRERRNLLLMDNRAIDLRCSRKSRLHLPVPGGFQPLTSELPSVRSNQEALLL